MTLLLDAYDSNKETVQLCKDGRNYSAKNSLVEIVDNETQAVLDITVGSDDQNIMNKLVRLWSYAEHRYVTPGEQRPKVGIDLVDTYSLMCNALLELNSPEVYLRENRESKEGYSIDSAAILTIINAAKTNYFANVRLAGCTSTCPTCQQGEKSGFVFENVTVEFNREPWIPPVQAEPTPPITKPISFFKNILQRISRSRV
ncbi:hypothetical protein KY333_05220 [Candidatus Woesearchaeota archaeon]|nr:hypothetical protein [Candidatus Woesearchaeota archaeon]MBW2994083.1 hypothetical protein [Candidatus Woesearchaeota archaeon]